MSENEIDKLVHKYGGIHRDVHTGNDLSATGYSIHYEKWFNGIKNDKINLLEIGVFKGHSLAVWSEYFKNGKVYGMDINTNPFNKTVSELTSKGAFADDTLGWVREQDSRNAPNLDTTFDVIIDDGHHKFDSQLKTFTNFFPFLNDGGLYIIEDVQHTATKLSKVIDGAEIIHCNVGNNKLILINK